MATAVPKAWGFCFGYNGFKLYETPAGLWKVLGPPNQDGETIRTPASLEEAHTIMGLN